LSGLTGVFTFVFSNSVLGFILNFFFFWSLLVLTISDIMYLYVPVLNIFIAGVSAVVYQVAYGGYKDMILGVVTGVSIPFVIALLYRIIRRREGLGEGDILVMFPVGAYFGFSGTLIILILSTMLGGLISFALLILGKSKESMIPFIPFVSISAVFVFLMIQIYPTELKFIPRFLW
ncbi:MAG: prepilin peptidase, partial [Brevinematales bacterium]